MKGPHAVAELLEKAFNQIHQIQMQGIPILNPVIKVQALGFQEYQGRILGVLITPWLMNLVMLPREGDDWSGIEIGHKRPFEFPSRTYKFMANDIEGIGPCQTHSLYSPMLEFSSHEQAVSVAQSFLETLMDEGEPIEEQVVDEALLGRIMRGEETPEVNLDDIANFNLGEETPEEKVRVEKELSRRDLLRGSFQGEPDRRLSK